MKQQGDGPTLRIMEDFMDIVDFSSVVDLIFEVSRFFFRLVFNQKLFQSEQRTN